MAKKVLKFDKYQRESKREPVDIPLPDGTVITVPVVDGGKMFQLEEAGVTRKTLRMAMPDDESWERLEPLLEALPDPDAVREFTMDLMQALGVAPEDRPPADGSRSSS